MAFRSGGMSRFCSFSLSMRICLFLFLCICWIEIHSLFVAGDYIGLPDVVDAAFTFPLNGTSWLIRQSNAYQYDPLSRTIVKTTTVAQLMNGVFTTIIYAFNIPQTNQLFLFKSATQYYIIDQLDNISSVQTWTSHPLYPALIAAENGTSVAVSTAFNTGYDNSIHFLSSSTSTDYQVDASVVNILYPYASSPNSFFVNPVSAIFSPMSAPPDAAFISPISGEVMFFSGRSSAIYDVPSKLTLPFRSTGVYSNFSSSSPSYNFCNQTVSGLIGIISVDCNSTSSFYPFPSSPFYYRWDVRAPSFHVPFSIPLQRVYYNSTTATVSLARFLSSAASLSSYSLDIVYQGSTIAHYSPTSPPPSSPFSVQGPGPFSLVLVVNTAIDPSSQLGSWGFASCTGPQAIGSQVGGVLAMSSIYSTSDCTFPVMPLTPQNPSFRLQIRSYVTPGDDPSAMAITLYEYDGVNMFFLQNFTNSSLLTRSAIIANTPGNNKGFVVRVRTLSSVASAVRVRFIATRTCQAPNLGTITTNVSSTFASTLNISDSVGYAFTYAKQSCQWVFQVPNNNLNNGSIPIVAGFAFTGNYEISASDPIILTDDSTVGFTSKYSIARWTGPPASITKPVLTNLPYLRIYWTPTDTGTYGRGFQVSITTFYLPYPDNSIVLNGGLTGPFTVSTYPIFQLDCRDYLNNSISSSLFSNVARYFVVYWRLIPMWLPLWEEIAAFNQPIANLWAYLQTPAVLTTIQQNITANITVNGTVTFYNTTISVNVPYSGRYGALVPYAAILQSVVTEGNFNPGSSNGDLPWINLNLPTIAGVYHVSAVIVYQSTSGSRFGQFGPIPNTYPTSSAYLEQLPKAPHVKGSPSVMTLTAAIAYGPNSYVTGIVTNATTVLTAGVPIIFYVQAVDQYGNPLLVGGSSTRAYLSSQAGYPVPTPVVIDLKNGTYRVQFTINTYGSYALGVFISSVDVFGSPFSLLVNPGPLSASVTSVTGMMPSIGIGMTQDIVVTEMDMYGNPLLNSTSNLTVTASGLLDPSNFVVSNRNESSSSPVHSISITVKNEHNPGVIIRFRIADQELAGSPFTLVVGDPGSVQFTLRTTMSLSVFNKNKASMPSIIRVALVQWLSTPDYRISFVSSPSDQKYSFLINRPSGDDVSAPSSPQVMASLQDLFANRSSIVKNFSTLANTTDTSYIGDIQFNYGTFPTPYSTQMTTFAPFLGFSLLLIVLIVGAMVWFFMKREEKVVKATSPIFCEITLFGLLMSPVTVILLIIYKPTPALCLGQIWVGHLGYALVFAPLFLKSWRLAAIFKRSTMKVVRIKDFHLFAIALVGLSFVAIHLGVWSYMSPPVPVYVVHGLTSYITCQSDTVGFPNSIFIIEGAVLAVGIWFCYRTKDVPTVFNESKHIALSLYAIAFVSIIILVLVKSVLVQPDIIILFSCVGLLFGATTVLLVLFGPKIWQMSIPPFVVLGGVVGTQNDTIGENVGTGQRNLSRGTPGKQQPQLLFRPSNPRPPPQASSFPRIQPVNVQSPSLQPNQSNNNMVPGEGDPNTPSNDGNVSSLALDPNQVMNGGNGMNGPVRPNPFQNSQTVAERRVSAINPNKQVQLMPLGSTAARYQAPPLPLRQNPPNFHPHMQNPQYYNPHQPPQQQLQQQQPIYDGDTFGMNTNSGVDSAFDEKDNMVEVLQARLRLLEHAATVNNNHPFHHPHQPHHTRMQSGDEGHRHAASISDEGASHNAAMSAVPTGGSPSMVTSGTSIGVHGLRMPAPSTSSPATS